MNNRGWVRIVEAFFSLLLIAGVFLIVLNKGSFGGDDASSRIYDLQLSVLREIELNDDLREDILCAPNSPPCIDPILGGSIENENEDGSANSNFPQSVQTKINERMPNSLICKSKICTIDVICELGEYIDQDVYVQSVAIAATLENYDLRQLKMFCWSD